MRSKGASDSPGSSRFTYGTQRPDPNIYQYVQNVRSEVIETNLCQRPFKKLWKTAAHYRNRGSKACINRFLGGRRASKGPGKLKDQQNDVGHRFKREISFIPISPEKLQDGLGKLFRYIDESRHPALKTLKASVLPSK